MGNLKEIIEQLELCGFQCVGGPLENNTAFIELKKMAEEMEERRLAKDKFHQDSIAEYDTAELERMNPPTCVLVNAVAKREGVQEIVVEPHHPFLIQTKNADGEDFKYPSEVKTGPARILVVID